jgi:hypothetical protein
MSPRTPTRIELHRLKYHWMGKKTDLIPFFRLDPEEKQIVAQDVLTQIYLNGGKDPYKIYAEVLNRWGIVCPHPQHMRLYSGQLSSEFPLTGHRWYSCPVCGCTCMNEDFQPTLRARAR